MKAQTVLARRTTADEVDEIGLRGQPIRTYWSQVRQYLRTAPGAIQEIILAEPVRDRESGDVEWYVQSDHEVLRYAELDDDGKRHIATVMADALRWADNESKRLADSTDSNDRLIGEILAAAFEVPSLDELYATNHRPIITSWGALAPGPRPERGVLARTFLSAAPVVGRHEGTFPELPEPPPAESNANRGVFSRRMAGSLALMVGGVSLLAAALFSLYSSCGIRIPLFDVVLFESCESDLTTAQFDSLQMMLDDERVLRDQLTGMNAELAELETMCRIEGQLPEQTPSPAPAPSPAPPKPATIPCGGEATESGGQGRERYTLSLGSEPGLVQIRYCMDNIEDALNARYQGKIVATTDGPTKGTGVLSFDYQPVDGEYDLIVDMIADSEKTHWSFVVSCPGQPVAQCS